MDLNQNSTNDPNIEVNINRQLLDGYGKLRGFVFTKSNKSYTIIFPSSQPENIHGIIGNSSNIIRSNYNDVVVNVFKNTLPSAGSYLPDGKIDGIWYPISGLGRYGVYVPIISLYPNEISVQLDPGPPNPIAPQGSNRILRLINMKKTIAIFTQTIKWLYDLSRLDLNEFVQRYIIVTNETGDSATFYDLNLIRRKLPEADNIEQGINAVQRLAPSMFYPNLPGGTKHNDYKIRLYNEQFGEKIIYALKTHIKFNEGLNRQPQKRIVGLITDESYFNKQNHVNIFIGQRLLFEWLDYTNRLKRTNSGALILYDQLKKNLNKETDPYIYVDANNVVSIIQNVVNGNKNIALAVALSW
ncbi:MAG: hypothetical protein KC414_14255, partial [Romboutsia sp.]|nr:hypothetical protein [Romboutsia sp.]